MGTSPVSRNRMNPHFPSLPTGGNFAGSLYTSGDYQMIGAEEGTLLTHRLQMSYGFCTILCTAYTFTLKGPTPMTTTATPKVPSPKYYWLTKTDAGWKRIPCLIETIHGE